MRGDSSSAMQWVKNCRGEKGKVRSIWRGDENLEDVGAYRGMVLPGKSRSGVERVRRRDNEVEGEGNPT